MRVAKYWRSKKLRYRLVRDMRSRQQAAELADTARGNGSAAKARVARELAGLAK